MWKSNRITDPILVQRGGGGGGGGAVLVRDGIRMLSMMCVVR